MSIQVPHSLAEYLEYVALIESVVLLVIATVNARQRSSASARWLVGLGIALVVTMGADALFVFVDSAPDHAFAWRFSSLALIYVPWLMLMYVRSIHPKAKRVASRLVGLVTALTIFMTIWLVGMPTFPGPDAPHAPWWYTLLVVTGIVGVVLALVAAVRSVDAMMTGAREGALVRGRILVVSLLAYGLAYGTWILAPIPTILVLSDLLLIASIGLLFTVAVWPMMTVRLVRSSMRRALDHAVRRMVGSVNPAADIDSILRDIALGVGVDSLVLTNQSGDVIAAVDAHVPTMLAGEVIEMEEHIGSFQVYAWVSSFAPPLREIDRHNLRTYVGLVDLALTRGRISEIEDKATSLLDHASARLDSANRLKDEFVASASHELRTPVTAIAGFAQTMCERWDELDDAQRRKFVTIIHEQATRLIAHVQDLLVTTRIERQGAGSHREVVHLADAVHRAAALLGFSEHELDLDVNVDAVEVNRFVLHETLTRYLSNIARMSTAPYHVSIEQRNDHVHVDVADSGVSLTTALKDQIFQRYVQQSRRIDEAGGGAGLAVVRDLVSAEGGKVSFRHDRGGTHFIADIPASRQMTISSH